MVTTESQQYLLLTEPDAAKACAVCAKTLANAAKAGQLKRVMIGRAVRYTPEDLREWIESLKSK